MKIIKDYGNVRPIDDDAEVTITLTGLEFSLIHDSLPLLRNNLISGCLHSLQLEKDLENAYYSQLLYLQFDKFFDVSF